jgi:hypothetical protein
MRDQRVFRTKQWGGKRQIIFPINRWLSHTNKEKWDVPLKIKKKKNNKT